MFRILVSVLVVFILGLSLTKWQNGLFGTRSSVNYSGDHSSKSASGTNISSDQDINLSNSNDNSNGGMLLLKAAVYTNGCLGFQVTLPAGWYMPDQCDSDPHFYDCATYDCPQGFEVENGDDLLSEGPADLTKHLEDDGHTPTQLNDLIKNATVLRYSGSAPGWPVNYDVFFEDRAYVISSSNELLEHPIFSTFTAVPR